MSEPVIIEQKRELEIMAESPAANTADIVRSDADGRRESRAPEPLLPLEDTAALRKRWEQVQTEFVDDPRASVEKADHLVADTIKQLAEVFAQQRTRLEKEWDQADQVSTEDLRQALRKYRSFFDRLLSAGTDSIPRN